VFGKTTDLDEQYPELAEVAKLILKKCHGLPLAIVTIGSFLSKQPKTSMVWRRLNEDINVELEMNQELGTIKDILIKAMMVCLTTSSLVFCICPYFLKTTLLAEDAWCAGGLQRITQARCKASLLKTKLTDASWNSLIGV
jgi:hypothetical protein